MPFDARRAVLTTLAVIVVMLGVGSPIATAQTSDPDLIVATRHVPPFAIQDEDGRWRGISIDLWRMVATDLEVTYRFEAMGLEEMIDAVAAGSVDVAAAALTMTADREAQVDFSHAFFASGLAIAVPQRHGGPFAGMGKAIFSAGFAKALAALVLVLVSVGLAAWLLERRRNPEHFGGGHLQGIGSGFWWAAVTMTTVGYGDKAPKSAAGKGLALVWMFASIITISGFTAAIASALTASHLSGDIQGIADLFNHRVGSVAQTAPVSVLRQLGVPPRGYATLGEALIDLERGQIDAVVYDAPLLRYLIANDHDRSLTTLPGVFEVQVYALALRPGSPLREAVNRSLLEVLASDEWDEIVTRYVGGLAR